MQFSIQFRPLYLCHNICLIFDYLIDLTDIPYSHTSTVLTVYAL